MIPRDSRGDPFGPSVPDHVLAQESREELNRRWTLRAAEYRAKAFAEAIFGGSVTVRLSGTSIEAGRTAGFPCTGLLQLSVPFADLASHRQYEAIFLACASKDALLRDVPFLYVFQPRERQLRTLEPESGGSW